jgi:hypothetical protein
LAGVIQPNGVAIIDPLQRHAGNIRAKNFLIQRLIKKMHRPSLLSRRGTIRQVWPASDITISTFMLQFFNRYAIIRAPL